MYIYILRLWRPTSADQISVRNADPAVILQISVPFSAHSETISLISINDDQHFVYISALWNVHVKPQQQQHAQQQTEQQQHEQQQPGHTIQLDNHVTDAIIPDYRERIEEYKIPNIKYDLYIAIKVRAYKQLSPEVSHWR